MTTTNQTNSVKNIKKEDLIKTLVNKNLAKSKSMKIGCLICNAY